MRARSHYLLLTLFLMLAAAPAMARVVYWNGPYNGTTDAWAINSGFSVSDSYDANGSFTALEFVYWDPVRADVLTTVDAQFGFAAFDGPVNTYSVTHNADLGTNQFGYELYLASLVLSSGPSPGPSEGYMTLSNACTTSGCSTNPIYWDENSGVGCDWPGCPSIAYENTLGSIPSEAFTLFGAPEPSSAMLFASGILAVAGALRRRLR